MVTGQSKLNDLSIYHEKILKLASFNKKSNELSEFSTSHKLKNPMCGDEVDVSIHLKSNLIIKISAKVRGCALCEASAGLVVGIFQNKKIPVHNFLSDFKLWLSDNTKELNPTTPEEIEVFFPIKSIKNRHSCIIMPHEAVFKALDKIK